MTYSDKAEITRSAVAEKTRHVPSHSEMWPCVKHKTFLNKRIGWTKIYYYNCLQETHKEMRYPNVAYGSILPPFLRLTPPTECFPWDDLRKILRGSQRMAKVQNGE